MFNMYVSKIETIQLLFCITVIEARAWEAAETSPAAAKNEVFMLKERKGIERE